MPFSRIGSLKDIRQPSLVPDRKSFEAGKNSRSLWWLQPEKVNSGIQFFWICCGIFLVDSFVQQPFSDDLRDSGHEFSALSSYLRERLAGQNLSNAARDLLLASWQTKSNKIYNSHFKKWLYAGAVQVQIPFLDL